MLAGNVQLSANASRKPTQSRRLRFGWPRPESLEYGGGGPWVLVRVGGVSGAGAGTGALCVHWATLTIILPMYCWMKDSLKLISFCMDLAFGA